MDYNFSNHLSDDEGEDIEWVNGSSTTQEFDTFSARSSNINKEVVIDKVKNVMEIPISEILTFNVDLDSGEIKIRLRYANFKKNTSLKQFIGADQITCRPVKEITLDVIERFRFRVQKALYALKTPAVPKPKELTQVHRSSLLSKEIYNRDIKPRGSIRYYEEHERYLAALEKAMEKKLEEPTIDLEFFINCMFGTNTTAIRWQAEGSFHHLEYYIQQRFKRKFSMIWYKFHTKWSPMENEDDWKLVKQELIESDNTRLSLFIK
ncbi:2821_t:CDS:2 [Ambispora gerdemannii]|uniref:2821_t:CDS:1 n=1 Tax=Ambispora gerdemannii TaxID=144530 RepID=A0A9N9BN63_9GLOM|nr:2821_t:CDS:2 [Ambispora gerdemannii]